MRNCLFILFLLGLPVLTSAQDKRKLEFKITGLKDRDTVYLANYYGNRLYYADTALANAKAEVVFARPSGYKAGIYAVVVPGPKYFEFIADEPEVLMESDREDLNGRMVVKNSVQNKAFYDYIRFLNDKKKEGDAIREKRESSTNPLQRSMAKQQLEDLDLGVRKHQAELVKQYPGTLFSVIVNMGIPTEQVELTTPDGKVDSLASYYNFRQHFWDNTALTDERIVRTPMFQNKLEEYIGKIVPQIPDTINRLADDLIGRLGTSEELFKFVVHNITYKYETSEIMGMDAVFVHMAETYYCPPPGQKSRAVWMDEEKLKKMCERARKMAPIVIGAKSRNIILPDTTEQRWIDLHKLPNEYIYVVFWDPHCGHCKKTLPDIYKQYQEILKPKGIEVFSVAKATDSTLFADWRKFIREHDMRWVNVGLTANVFKDARKNPGKYVPSITTIESLNYMDTWDVHSTPKFFVLDGDRKIVGKSITPEQAADLIERLRAAKKR
ncbi:MAG: DUF5106 domain-containing protein [Flavobacteriales bacterium]|nr:DUF5106 domain-containing protein [Flavobacteriales bacterium]